MSISLELDFDYAFEVHASFDRVFELLSDVPRASALHPTLASIVDLGDGRYRWEMKRYGTEKIHVQTIYTCQYQACVEKHMISWEPVHGEGNALVSGHFKLTPLATGTRIDAYIKSAATLPVPNFMKGIALQFIAKESKKVNEKYITSLITEFGGGRTLRV